MYTDKLHLAVLIPLAMAVGLALTMRKEKRSLAEALLILSVISHRFTEGRDLEVLSFLVWLMAPSLILCNISFSKKQTDEFIPDKSKTRIIKKPFLVYDPRNLSAEQIQEIIIKEPRAAYQTISLNFKNQELTVIIFMIPQNILIPIILNSEYSHLHGAIRDLVERESKVLKIIDLIESVLLQLGDSQIELSSALEHEISRVFQEQFVGSSDSKSEALLEQNY